MNIFITGGSGFIGCNFILDWLGYSSRTVVNLDKLTYASSVNSLKAIESNSRYQFIRGDICNKPLVERLFNEYSPVAVLNFAAESHVDRSIHGPDEFVNTNIFGTFNLLECARKFLAGLNEFEKSRFRFVHISTDEVYGSLSSSDPAFVETSRYLPSSPYSASKASSDHLVRAWHHTYGVPTIITNCSNNYGPNQFPEKLIPLIIVSALAGKKLPIYGDGLQIRDWLYVKDHCSAIRRVLEAGRIGETYNIGGWNEKTNLEIVHIICALLDEIRPKVDGTSYSNQISFVKDRPGHDRRYAIDARKIENELGWRPSETFETGIRKTVEWYLNNPDWVQEVQSEAYRLWVNQQYAFRS